MSAVVVATIAGIAGVLAAAVPVWLTRKRHPSRHIQDGASIIEAAEGVVGLLRDELARLSDDVAALRAELGAEERRTDKLARELGVMRRVLADYRRGVALLIAQIGDLGHHPAWRPSDDDEITGTEF